MTRCGGLVVVAMLAASGALAQDAYKTADLTGAGTATCVESTLPKGCMYLPASGIGTIEVRVSGTWAGTVVVEESPEGDSAGTWTAMDIVKLGTGAWTLVTNTTANATFVVSPRGRTVRIRASVYTSGTIVLDVWLHSRPWAPVYSRDASGNMVTSFASGSDVDVAKIGTAATVNAEQAAKTADVTLIAAVASTRLVFAQCAETAATAAAATVILRHGVEATGTCTGNYIARIELAPNETGDPLKFDGRGLAVASGVCLDITAGTVDCWSASLVEAAP